MAHLAVYDEPALSGSPKWWLYMQYGVELWNRNNGTYWEPRAAIRAYINRALEESRAAVKH